MALTGVMINFVLNYVLIPEFGSFGAAQATLVTQSLTALIQMIFAFRIFKLRFEPLFTVKLSLFLLTLIFSVYWFHGEFGELKYGLYLFPLFIIFGALLGVFPLKKSLALLLSRKER
jgi:O-antigen/teichoic acid export membrane protein